MNLHVTSLGGERNCSSEIPMEDWLSSMDPEDRVYWHAKQIAKAMKEAEGGEWFAGIVTAPGDDPNAPWPTSYVIVKRSP